jgi:hypothetical protein
MPYLVTANQAANGPGNDGAPIKWTAGKQRWIEDEQIAFYQSHSDVFTVGSISVDPVAAAVASQVAFPGRAAVAYIDFNTGAAEAGCSITIGGVVYQEADTAVPATGVWTNGASAANSATSFIAAVNGDARAAVPFTAVADVSGDGAWLFWDAVGTAGNKTISTTSATRVTVRNSVGGVAAGTRQVAQTTVTVTTQDLLSGAIEVPLPFAPAGWTIQAYASNGLTKYHTNLVTVQTSPDRLRIATAGATALVNDDVLHITAWN